MLEAGHTGLESYGYAFPVVIGSGDKPVDAVDSL
jgi:hypothetical protein